METAFHHAPIYRRNVEGTAVIVWLVLFLIGFLLILKDDLTREILLLWIIGGILTGCRLMPRAFSQYRLHQRLRRSTLRRLSLEDLTLKLAHPPEDLFLGDGFEWQPQHAQWTHELLAQGGPKGSRDSAWAHQLSERHEDLFQPLKETQGHTLILGTTGSGKTRTFDLLISQAILRGEAVIIIDPKGDRDLRATAERTLKALGKSRDFILFHPAFPKDSVRMDPLRNFSRPSELSSRIAATIPSTNPSDPFKAFSQRALDQIIQGLLFLEERPTLITLRRILEGGPESLVQRALEHHLKTVLGSGWKSRLSQAARSRPGHNVSALAGLYRDHVASEHPSLPLEGLLSLWEHDRNHFGKMVASLLPVMTMLTSGPLEGLLSPDASPIEDPRPITDLGRIIARQQVAYIGLDALSDGPVATMIGLLLLSDLTAVAGERYNQGIPPTPVNIFIDEAAEIINDPAIQLLNKGRGAGIRMTIATQTIADFTARLGSEAKTLQVLGNVNNLLALRVQDAETQRYVTQNLPTFRRKTILRTLGNATLGPEPHLFTGNLGERLIEEDADLVPSALLGQLADLHYLGKLAGGRVIKGRIPLLVDGMDP